LEVDVLKKAILIMLVVAAMLLVACAPAQEKGVSVPESCGDSQCSASEATRGNCPADCPAADKQYESKLPSDSQEASGDCVGEGGTIPVIPNPPVCCSGLTLIDRKEASILGISGICTAKCGNGACDSETESPKNCPADCQEVMDSQPSCDGAGTSKEGWYQNDKILMYAKCAGCYAECKNKGTPSEGWYNACDGKQIKRICN